MSRHDIVGSGLHSSQDTSDIVVDRKAACEEAEKDPRKVIMGTTPSGLHGQDDSVCVYWSLCFAMFYWSPCLLPAASLL